MPKELSRAQRREALDEALDSALFERAPKLSQLLAYIGEQALADHPEALTEREIGHAVFGRAGHYDPGEDNIVRVQVRNLRHRLDRYYREEDPQSDVLIRIPKGHYIPEFVYRDRAKPADQPPQTPSSPPTWRTWVYATCALALAFWLGLHARSLAPEPETTLAAAPHPIWDSLFDSEDDVLLVTADATFALSQRLLGRGFELREYLETGVEERGRARAAVPFDDDEPLADILELITWREQTNYGDTLASQMLVELARARGRSVVIEFPRRVHFSDFKGRNKRRNVVLLGNTRGNPWVELFEPRMNFLFRYDHGSGTPYFVNRDPQLGEQPEYRRGGQDGHSDETYAVVAVTPNLSGEGYALIIAGGDDSGSDAARDFLFGGTPYQNLLPSLELSSDRPSPYFEVLLKTSRIGGLGSGTEIVAFRRIADGPPPAATTSVENRSR